MSGIVTMENPAEPALTRGGIVLENHADKGLGPIPEDHIYAETVHAQGGRADEVILIPRSQDGEDTVHICMDMLAEVQTLPRIRSLTMRPWMP